MAVCLNLQVHYGEAGRRSTVTLEELHKSTDLVGKSLHVPHCFCYEKAETKYSLILEETMLEAEIHLRLIHRPVGQCLINMQ